MNEAGNIRVASVVVGVMAMLPFATAVSAAVDLRVDRLSVDRTTVSPGQRIRVTWRVRRSGSSGAYRFYHGIYWSTNSIISRSDTRLRENGRTSLSRWTTSVGNTTTVTIPASARAGRTYYLGYLADSYRRVRETNERNNTRRVAVRVGRSSPSRSSSSRRVATPTLSPRPGAYADPMRITIRCSTRGARIRYSTNGSIPTIRSATYRGPVTIRGRTMLRARAFKSRMADSSVAGGVYTPDSRWRVAAPTFSHRSGTYSRAMRVSIRCSTRGTTIRYTTNGSIPTVRSRVYRGPVVIRGRTTLRAKAFKSRMNDSGVTTAVYTIGSMTKAPECVDRPKDPELYKHVPKYGRYGGPGNSGPGKPIDYMDGLFKQHDELYAKAKSRKDIAAADALLAARLRGMSYWQRRKLSSYGKEYRRLAISVFIPKAIMEITRFYTKDDGKPFCR